MKITPSTLKLFNDEHFDLITLLDIGDDMKLNGSFAKTLWASDVDLYQSVNVNNKEDISNFLDKMIELLNTISKNPMISVQELKVGDTKFRSLAKIMHLTHDQIVNAMALSDKKRIKLDLIVMMNGYLEDITMIWDVIVPNVDDIPFNEWKNAIIDDIKKYYKEGKLFKVLKRIQSLLEEKKNHKPLTKIEQETLSIANELTQNTRMGMTYLTLSRITSLRETKHSNKEDRQKARSNIKEDIGIKLQLPNLAKKLSTSPKQVFEMLQRNLNNAIKDRVSTLIKALKLK